MKRTLFLDFTISDLRCTLELLRHSNDLRALRRCQCQAHNADPAIGQITPKIFVRSEDRLIATDSRLVGVPGHRDLLSYVTVSSGHVVS